MSYPTYNELTEMISRTHGAFTVMDSSLLNKQGRRTKTMWKFLRQACIESRDIDDMLTHLSLLMDELVEKSSLAIIDTGCVRETVADLRRWVMTNVDRTIWQEYPMIVNPYAA